ncbi:MAG: hypothetical protein JNM25_08720 [Planctomycetes bacterium]|nr:hypothetical protein [Planctomycetota bacterium]
MASCRRLRLGLVLWGAAVASAQDPVWRIPPLGAVEYRREWRASASDLARTAGAARDAPSDGKVPERYLHRVPPAPWVCQGELDAAGRELTGPVRDLRDVFRALACDLGSRGSARGRFPRLLPFGDVTVGGSWSSLQADGSQTLRATLQARPPGPGRGEPRDTAERLRAFCLRDADGTLTIERRIDGERGVVASYRAQLDLVVQEDVRAYRRLQLEDAWDLVAVRENQDFDFRKRVAAAIEAGVGFVRDAIDANKSFLIDSGGDERNFGSGRLALGLLTLVHGGVPRDDPVLVEGFDELRRRRLEDTYSLATALMALAARHAPSGEAERIRNGDLAAVPRRELDERDRKVAQRWLDRLLDNVDPRVDRDDLLRFNYTRGPRYDTSLQQYGLLGMWSAHTCGLDVPARAFAAAGRQLLAVQGPAGERLRLRLASHALLREAAGTDVPPRVPERGATARGFAYQEPDEPPFGSMTSAGISGLLLAQAGIAAGGTDRTLARDLDTAVQNAFAWLAAEFSVRCNPGFAERADHHWYYWLYGLERSCELAGVAWLHGRDWYYEGALQLLSQQQGNGSFRAEQSSSLLLDTTCFAVLFLAKATPPAAVTPR